MDSNSRLRIAARIHFALLRHYGENVAIATLLEDEDAAKEALWVCDASGDADMASLARQFRAAPKLMPTVGEAGNVQQDMPWAADTSGFGVTQLPDYKVLEEICAPKPSRWLNLSGWLRRAGS